MSGVKPVPISELLKYNKKLEKSLTFLNKFDEAKALKIYPLI